MIDAAPPPPRSDDLPVQTTLACVCRARGRGLHSGVEASVVLHPAPEDHGLWFVRERVRIPAACHAVVGTRRGTSLGQDHVSVHTVEHLLSALRGLEVDNVLVAVDGPEIPILDGSARPWVELLLEAGIARQHAAARVVCPPCPVAHHEGDTWLLAVPSPSPQVVCVTDFAHPMLGVQCSTHALEAAHYAVAVAPARTFGFSCEVDALRSAGLARGGALDNAIVVYDDGFSAPLRFPDECHRHKVLDLWGDLALLPGRLRASVVAVKPGHSANTAFAARIASISAAAPQQ